MNKVCITPAMHRSWIVLLLFSFFLVGCAETRYDDTVRKYSLGKGEGVTANYSNGKHAGTKKYRYDREGNRYRVDKNDGATAEYTYRLGHRPDTLPPERGEYAAASQTGEGPPLKIPEGMPLVIDASNILFDFDKAEIKNQFHPELDLWVQFFLDNPQVKADIHGHADSTGPEVYNQGLSERRALAVINYLVKRGVERSRLTPVGFGETQPVESNSTKDGRQKNRRVELKY